MDMAKRRRATAQRRRPFGRVRLYADEDIHEAIVLFLRENKVNVTSARELGYSGRDDRFQFAEAGRQGRALLTGDRGFLDNRRFPLGGSHCVIVLDLAQDDTAAVGHALEWLIAEVVPSGEAIDGTKIAVRADHMELHWKGRDGTAQRQRLSLAEPVVDDPTSPGKVWALLGVRFSE
jgi:predicted nuclease of predicted toxin-antitoxin system